MFKKNSKVGDLLDVILLLLIVVSMYIMPTFASIFSLTGNILMCVIAYRSNVVKSIGCIIVTYAFMAMFCLVGNEFSLTYLYDCVLATFNLLLTGFSIGILLKCTGEISKILMSGTTAGLVVFALEIVRYRITESASVLDALVNEPVKKYLGAYAEMVKASGIDFAEMFGTSMEDIIWAMQQSLAMILPALLILSSLAVAFVIYAVSKNILGAYKVKLYTRNFCEYQMPASSSLALVASYLVTMFSTSTFGAACSNILIILTCLYVICGFSVVEYKFKAKIRLPILRIIIYITIIFISSFVSMILPFFNVITILMIIGMFDGVYDFRKLKAKDIIEEEE